MYRNIERFYEPREILKMTSEAYCEMSKEEQGFLCGCIKEKKPQKLIEVGVAGGGTTAVIMKCLEHVSPDAEVWSVDINKECYRRKGMPTGFQLEEVKDHLSNYKNHTFCLGGILPQFIEGIGGDIDFAMLDTAHSMPGEILDFL